MVGSRYRIVGLLGRGGMGEVYRADDLELGQSVALKFLPEKVASDARALERFRGEVRTARDIAHPNVCRVYDIAEIDGHVFLSMEYIDGDDLDHVLRRMGRPSPEKAMEIARQICLGLAAAHENGVLHRDLKPANIMLDGRGRVRITDFGLAGLADELAATPERAGTPAYMAPIDEHGVGHRRDRPRGRAGRAPLPGGGSRPAPGVGVRGARGAARR
jgi:serine/threonine-protein kinase